MGASFMNFVFFWRPANCISSVLLNYIIFLFFGKIKWWWWCPRGVQGPWSGRRSAPEADVD